MASMKRPHDPSRESSDPDGTGKTLKYSKRDGLETVETVEHHRVLLGGELRHGVGDIGSVGIDSTFVASGSRQTEDEEA
jgi:hypothetical protein